MVDASDPRGQTSADPLTATPPPPPLPPSRSRSRRWLRWLRRITETSAGIAGFATMLLWCSVPNTAQLADDNPLTTAFIELRRDDAEAAGRPFALKWQWRPLGSISRYLRAAVIYAEDYNFYRHDGVDWGAMQSAVAANWHTGSFAIGGSTITQQLAKNLYLSPRRSVVRKLRELLIATSLERQLSKQRILELYLNVVEWGDGVFGAEAAARHWFGHSARQLAPAEAVRLAIALPNPIARAPNVRDAKLTRKAVRIIHLLRMQGLLDAAQERAALDQVGAPNERTLDSPKQPAVPEPARPDIGQPDREPPEAPAEAPPEPAAPVAPAPATPDPSAESSSESGSQAGSESGSDRAPIQPPP